MSGIPVARADAGNHVDPLLVFDGLERLQRGLGIGLGIDRSDLRSPARRVAAVEGGDLGFLDSPGIRQHVGTQVDRSARRQDPAAKPLTHQLRQQSAMVDMRMRQQHGIDVGGPEREGSVVQFLQGLLTLEQAAVDQKAAGLRFKEVARAGHRARGAAKPNGHTHEVFSGKCLPLISRRKAVARMSSSGIALVGWGTLDVERTDRMPASANGRHLRSKQGVGNDGVDGRRTRSPERPCAGDQSASRRDDIIDQQNRPAGDQSGLGKPDFDGAIAAAVFRATVCASPSWPARSLTQGRDSASGPIATVAGSIPVCAAPSRWPPWPTGSRPRFRETRPRCRRCDEGGHRP